MGKNYFLSTLPANAQLVLLSVFLTSIGNGMQTMAMSLLLYQATGSIASFGIVIIFETILNALLQLLAGSMVDRGNPKVICIICDLIRGIILCTVGILLFSLPNINVLLWAFLLSFCINIFTPFYRSATFVIGPTVANGSDLTKYNSFYSNLLQTGILMGTGIAGPLIQYYGPYIAIIGNGVSFLLATIAIFLAKIPVVEQRGWTKSKLVPEFIEDWKEILKILKNDKSIVLHNMLCSGDFLVVSFINLSLPLIVTHFYHNNFIWLSILEISFAVGAIAMSYFTVYLINKIKLLNIAIIGISLEGLLLLVLAFNQYSYLIIVCFLLIGAINNISLTVYMSSLQQRCQGAIKGRISTIRQLFLSMSTLVLIPLVSKAYNYSLSLGLVISALICILFCTVAFVFSRPAHFGGQLLTKKTEKMTH